VASFSLGWSRSLPSPRTSNANKRVRLRDETKKRLGEPKGSLTKKSAREKIKEGTLIQNLTFSRNACPKANNAWISCAAFFNSAYRHVINTKKWSGIPDAFLGVV